MLSALRQQLSDLLLPSNKTVHKLIMMAMLAFLAFGISGLGVFTLMYSLSTMRAGRSWHQLNELLPAGRGRHSNKFPGLPYRYDLIEPFHPWRCRGCQVPARLVDDVFPVDNARRP